MGSLQQYGDGFRVWYDIGPDPVSGRRRRRTKILPTEESARAFLDQVEREVAFGVHPDPHNGRIRVGEFVDKYLSSRVDVEHSTRVGYASKLHTHVIPRIGEQRLVYITGDLLSTMYGQMIGDGVSVATVKHVHRVLHGMFKLAVDWKYVPENPAATARLPKYERPEVHTWTDDQLHSFIRAVDEHPWRAGYMTAAATGMRRGEVCGLQWGNVDLDQGLIQIRNTRLEVDGRVYDKPYPKSKKGRRTIPIDRAVIAVLASERTRQKKERLRLGEAWQQSDYVVVRSNGEGVSPNQFTKTFKRLHRALQLPDVRLHDLRHTWGTLAIANGVDPKTVSELLGHASVNFTLDVYVGQVDEKRRQAATVMGRLISDSIDYRLRAE